MEHITVARLQTLLERLPKSARIAPSVGNVSLIVWDSDDATIIGEIGPGGEDGQFTLRLHEDD